MFLHDLLKNLKKILNPGAVVVARYYLNVARPYMDGFQDVTDLHQNLLILEKVQMYHIRIYKMN